MKRLSVLFSFLIVLSPAARAVAAAGRPSVVAVFEIQDKTNRPKKLIASLTDYLRVKLAESGTLKVVDKGEQESQLKKLITEEKKSSYKACFDQSCQIPLGKELAADKILRGKLTKFGKNYIVSVEMIDLASGASAGAASDKSNGTEEGLMASVERIAKQITGDLAAAEAAAAAAQAEAQAKAEAEAQPEPAPSPKPTPTALAPETTATTRVEHTVTTTELVMIIGGGVVFAGAYAAEVLGNLDNSRSNLALLPVIGPVLIEQQAKSDPGYQSNKLNYVGAGVQFLGIAVAIVGLIMWQTIDPTPPLLKSAEREDGLKLPPVSVVLLPHGMGVGGTF